MSSLFNLPEIKNPPVVIRANDVSKRFVIRKDKSLKERIVNFGRSRRHKEDFWALRDIKLEIKAGSSIGLVGANGSGKSTLLKVIGGILDPTSGSVARRGRIAALLELGAGFHPDLSGRENVFLNASIMGLSRAETDAQFDDILAFSGIGDFIDTQVKFYSSGMYVRLAFAVAVHTNPDLLLVDEVLAVGDEAFQRKCLDKIRAFQAEGRTIVLVTHSLSQVTELCDRAILLNRGEVVFDGEPRDAVVAFRDILEDRRVAEADAQAATGTAAAAAVVSTREAQILAATAGPAGRPGLPVQAGDDITVALKLDLVAAPDSWACAIQIDNTLGQVAYGTTTKRLGIELHQRSGTFTVEFTLSDSRFGTGKYFVNVSLIDSSGRHFADLSQACSFDVANNSLAVGMTYAEPSFAFVTS